MTATMGSRRRLDLPYFRAALFCSSLVVAVGGCSSAPERQGPMPDGPMIEPKDGHSWTVPARLGREFTDGLEVLQVAGTKPARITRVESIGGEKVLEVLGARLAGPGRTLGFTQYFDSWPPRSPEIEGQVVDAKGAILHPKRKRTRGPVGSTSYELLVGYRFLRDDFAVRQHLNIHYTVGGKAYVSRQPARLIVCPTDMTEQSCFARSAEG